MITQRDIARSLGVSVSAVSLALSGRPGVSDELRGQVAERATELGYRPNASAVALRTRRSRVLGLLIRNLSNPFFLDLVDGFDRTCASLGYQVMIGSSRYEEGRERELLDAFRDRGVDGLAVAPIGTGRHARAWRDLTGRPLVLLNASTDGDPQAMAVRPDNVAAVDLAVRHLVELGHRRIAMVVAPRDKTPDAERWQRFEVLAARLDRVAVRVETELSLAAACAAVGRALDAVERPTAFVTNSDYLALAVYQAAAARGLRVPDDVSVVGHDDLPTSALLAPALTTVRVDRHDIGERAASMLVDTLAGRAPARREICVAVELRVRASTAPPA